MASLFLHSIVFTSLAVTVWFARYAHVHPLLTDVDIRREKRDMAVIALFGWLGAGYIALSLVAILDVLWPDPIYTVIFDAVMHFHALFAVLCGTLVGVRWWRCHKAEVAAHAGLA